MMADVSVDEITEISPHITNGIIKCTEYFLYSIKEFENKYMTDRILNSKDLINYTSNAQEWLQNCDEDVSKKVSKNANYLETIKEKTEKLKVLQNSLHKEIAKYQKEVEILKQKISNINKKKEKLGDMRDQIQMCKLLTDTSFIYKGSSISGYVACKRIECFELDPETLSKSDIINSLYNKVKKSSF